jgi:drug/metabolite transporter (DMT)-like permease
MNPLDLGLLLLQSAITGSAFLFIRIAAPAFGPVFLILLRVGIAGVLLLSVTALQGRAPRLRDRWRDYLVHGFLNAALPFTLLAWAELSLTASMAAILNATTPLFTALFAALWLGEQISWRRGLGLLLGFLGVGLVVGWTGLSGGPGALLPALACTGATICYGLGAVWVKRRFQGAPPVHLAIGQQLFALPFLLPPGLLMAPKSLPSASALLAVLALAILATAVAQTLFFAILQRLGPTRTMTNNFLIPCFAVLWSWLFLKEGASPWALFGLGLILTSLLLVFEVGARKPNQVAPGQ